MSQEEKRRQWIQALRDLPFQLLAAVSQLNDRQLDTPYREGGWTVRQVVHHLADAHLHGYLRTKWVVAETEPTLKTWEQDDWSQFSDAKAGPVEHSLQILTGLHRRWCHWLERLDASDWNRTARHPELGTVSLSRLVAMYAAHGHNHLQQILELKKRMGWE